MNDEMLSLKQHIYKRIKKLKKQKKRILKEIEEGKCNSYDPVLLTGARITMCDELIDYINTHYNEEPEEKNIK